MFQSLFKTLSKNRYNINLISKQKFLTSTYSCGDSWEARLDSHILQRVNLDDLYNDIDLQYNNSGTVSAIDVDIFANAIKDPSYLEELRDLLHKLRLSAETCNTLESTHHATVRNFLQYGKMQNLVEILSDPLNYGIFLDEFTATMLLDKLLISQDYVSAAKVASIIMLQEDFTHEITCALCLYACYKFLTVHKTLPIPEENNEENKKVEEIKIRIKFLRNPYFDDHFDLTDGLLLAGKTLAWIGQTKNDNIYQNLELLGFLFYKKYTKCSACLEKMTNLKVYNEVIELFTHEKEKQEENNGPLQSIENVLSVLSQLNKTESGLEDDLKLLIENAINRNQQNDIDQQIQCHKHWEGVRSKALQDQIARLDRIKRIHVIEERQKEMKTAEQKLWFFENEEKIDLVIEEKKSKEPIVAEKKMNVKKIDEDYIPPEIVPKRK